MKSRAGWNQLDVPTGRHCQAKEMTRGSRVPYSRALHSHADQSCSPNTSLAFSRSSAIAASGVLFGSGRAMCLLPHQPQQSQCARSSAIELQSIGSPLRMGVPGGWQWY
jgi:hypothetical protein